MEQTMVPQIDATNPNPTPDADAMALPNGSTMEQLQHVAKEMGITLDESGNVAGQPKAQPVPAPVEAQQPNPQPQAAQPPATPVEVPPKFQNADGTVNEEKLQKSTTSLEDRIAYFKQKEREYQQTQNRVNNPPPAPVQAQPQAFVPPQGLSPLEIQAAQDILADAQALGVKMTQAEAIVQARAQVRIAEARLNAEIQSTEDIRRELAESRMTQELSDLIKSDPSLLDQKVADAVLSIRQANPKMSYRDAFVHHLGQLELQKRTGQVQTPNPTGTTVRQPPTPVGPVTRVGPVVDVSNPKSLPDDVLLAEIRKIYPSFRNR